MTRRDGQITVIQFTRRTGLHPLEPSSYTSVPPSPAMPWRLAIGSPEFGTGDVPQSGSDLEARIGTTGRGCPLYQFADHAVCGDAPPASETCTTTDMVAPNTP